METLLRSQLYNTLIDLEKTYISNLPEDKPRKSLCGGAQDKLVDQTVEALHILQMQPQSHARKVARQSGIGKEDLALAYKLIQHCDAARDFLQTAENRDYFHVVDNYFNSKLFTVVFFVGLSCPSRCVFCPNVTIDENGKRTLRAYENFGKSKIEAKHITKIFDDLKTIKSTGKNILVKISGGLEPLTDMPTVKLIAKLCKAHGFHVKLFTNGILLNAKKRRDELLDINDVRISLGTTDAVQYEEIYFGWKREKKKKRYALDLLKNSIREFVRERDARQSDCRIGFNSVVMASTCEQMGEVVKMALDLGIDYIDFKPDYFSLYDDQLESRIASAVYKTKKMLAMDAFQDIHVFISNSLSQKDLYWQVEDEMCDALKQSDYKIFITPFGQCTPVHYGAFPNSSHSTITNKENFFIGTIDDNHSLIEILHNPSCHPMISMRKFNPFEMMLSLEITREEKDAQWGIPISCSPYHTSLRDKFPSDLGNYLKKANGALPEIVCHSKPRRRIDLKYPDAKEIFETQYPANTNRTSHSTPKK